MNPENIVNLKLHPIHYGHFTKSCKAQLDRTGVLVIENYICADAVLFLQGEARDVRPLAFFCHQNHNVYLLDSDPSLPKGHIRNLEQVSDKGCVTHDQIPDDSPLRTLYEWPDFRVFLKSVLNVPVFPYADTLSSININYYEKGLQLGWH